MDSSEDLERGRKSSDDVVVVEDAGGSVNNASSSSSAGRGRPKKTRNSVATSI